MDDRGNENARPGNESGRAQGEQHETKSTKVFEVNDAAWSQQRKPSLQPYIDAGLQLIPLHRWNAYDEKKRPRGKTPRDGAWQAREYDSNAVADAAERDGINVGVRLPASVMVLDVDPRNFGDGDSLLALMLDTGMDLRGVPRTATGSGGSHYWFSKPIDVQLLDSLPDYPGVEFKSFGRQVVSAGSRHPNGVVYAWQGDIPDLRVLPDIPASLLELTRRPINAHGEAAGLGEMTPSMLAETLEQLDPEGFAAHEDWLNLMMACHHATDGEGRQEFIDWSTGDAAYADHAHIIGRRWDSLHAEAGRGGRPITIKYLYKVMQEHGGQVAQVAAEDDFEPVEMADPAGFRDPNEHRLEEMNENHFTVLHGGKFLVGREAIHPTLGHKIIEWFSDESIRKFHNMPLLEVGTRVVPLGKFWTEHARRRQYGRVVFDPSPNRTETTAYNLWRGWAVQPRPGDWSAMKRLLRDVLCAGDPDAYEYVIRWAAFMVQQPHVPAETVLVFKGGKGRGKGTFCRELVGFAGQHGRQVANNQHFTGRFNDHLMDCICLFVDEGFWAGDKRAEGVLKNLITERVLTFEAKGMPLVQGPNLLHIVMASNEAWVVPATEDERRFAVFEASDDAFASLPKDFFADLVDQMDDGGREAMLHDLLGLDIRGWHPRKDIPRNDARGDQMLRSLCRQEPVVALWFDALSRGEIPVSWESGQTWPTRSHTIEQKQKDAFTDAVNARAASMRYASTRDYSKTSVAQFFSSQGFDVKTKVAGLRAWHIPRLDVAREAFEKFVGMKIEWDD